MGHHNFCTCPHFSTKQLPFLDPKNQPPGLDPPETNRPPLSTKPGEVKGPNTLEGAKSLHVSIVAQLHGVRCIHAKWGPN